MEKVVEKRVDSYYCKYRANYDPMTSQRWQFCMIFQRFIIENYFKFKIRKSSLDDLINLYLLYTIDSN